MVFVRTFIDLQQVFSRRPSYIVTCIQNQVKGQRYFRSFSTSGRISQRGKWPGKKSKPEPVETPFDGVAVENGHIDSSRMFKPFVFTVAFSTASFTCAAIWQYENLRTKAFAMVNQPGKWFQDRLNNRKHGRWRNEFNNWWNGLSEGQKIFAPICFANMLVFLAWRIPQFQPAMVKYFCSNPVSSVLCWPMVLSTFSHYSGVHIFANMFVLHSFSTGAVMNMGKEQFVGFYMAAGVISSFASYIYKVIASRPGLSIGASGAIMGVLGYTCSRFPDLDLSIIFLPFITFKAASALKVIMAIDATGVLLGWRYFDHAAHLGGALFGMFWCYWGSKHIWHNREPVVQAWHNIRGSIK